MRMDNANRYVVEGFFMSFRSRFFACAVLSAAALTASAGAWAQADDDG